MIKNIFDKWDDLIILIILIYMMLVFFNLVKYPSESWKLKIDKLKETKFGGLFRILLPLAIILLLVKMIFL
jgi:hypothetical protein